jgi:hypothetical protein
VFSVSASYGKKLEGTFTFTPSKIKGILRKPLMILNMCALRWGDLMA